MTETRALTIAGAAHLVLFAAMSLTWGLMSDELPTFDDPVPVEIVDIADMPTITERPDPTLAAAPRETVEAVEVTPEEPLAEMPPLDVPPDMPVEKAPPPPEAKPQPKPETPKPKPAQELSAPVDKAKAVAERRLDEQDFAEAITSALPSQAKISSRQQATLAQAIRERIYKCWDPNAGGPDSDKITTTLLVKMRRDGTPRGRPEVLSQAGVSAANAGYGRTARDAAIRAVMNPACSLEGLPADLYAGGWEEFELNFDPKDF